MMKSLRFPSSFIFLLLLASHVGRAGDSCGTRFYLLLFGGQAAKGKPMTAHVWATYVRVDAAGAIEEHTISWLPATGKVRPLALRPEPGINHNLAETLLFICGPRQKLALWGPYEIDECRFRQAVRRKAALDSGAFQYKLTDGFNRRPTVEHCLHAVAGAHPDVYRRCKVVMRYGVGGAALVASAMRTVGMIRESCGDHDWLLDALGLVASKFDRRTAGDARLTRR